MAAAEEIYRIVRALRSAQLPRNRHFELHATPTVRAARRVHRFLRSVELDLRRATEVRVARRPDGGVRLELAQEQVRFRRTIELDAHAHALLLENSENANLFSRAG
jgi:hypothetical protein